MKTIIIIIISLFTISIFSSESSAQNKTKNLKVLDIMSEDQLNSLADSTGMINVSDLCVKIMEYSPNTYYINIKDKEKAGEVIKRAKQSMIIGDVYVFVFGYDQNAQMCKYRDSYGKEKTEITATIQEPVLSIDTTLAKRFKFIFASYDTK